MVTTFHSGMSYQTISDFNILYSEQSSANGKYSRQSPIFAGMHLETNFSLMYGTWTKNKKTEEQFHRSQKIWIKSMMITPLRNATRTPHLFKQRMESRPGFTKPRQMIPNGVTWFYCLAPSLVKSNSVLAETPHILRINGNMGMFVTIEQSGKKQFSNQREQMQDNMSNS